MPWESRWWTVSLALIHVIIWVSRPERHSSMSFEIKEEKYSYFWRTEQQRPLFALLYFRGKAEVEHVTLLWLSSSVVIITISNATISWQWHCVINYVEAVKFIPLFWVKKGVEVSGKWQLHSTWHYVLSRWLVKYRQVFLCRFRRKTETTDKKNKTKNTHSSAVFQFLVNSFSHFGHCTIIVSVISILI